MLNDFNRAVTGKHAWARPPIGPVAPPTRAWHDYRTTLAEGTWPTTPCGSRIRGRIAGADRARVDDHADFRMSARAWLEADGLVVVGEAATGVAAIRAAIDLAGCRPADIRLPDLDGIVPADTITALPWPPDVVLVSSRDRSVYGAKLTHAPVRGFLPKAELSGATLRGMLADPGRRPDRPDRRAGPGDRGREHRVRLGPAAGLAAGPAGRHVADRVRRGDDRRHQGVAILLVTAGFAWFVRTAWPPAVYRHRPLVHLLATYPGARAARGPVGRSWRPATRRRCLRRRAQRRPRGGPAGSRRPHPWRA